MKANYFKERYLLYRAKNKDAEAFAQVYDIYTDRIYRFIYFKISSQEEAQDLTSEVFLKTWQYIIDGNEVKNLNAFFYTIARNLVIDYYRKNSQKEVSLSEMEKFGTEPSTGKKEIERVEREIEFSKIEKQMGKLKDEFREVIILRYIEGMSIKEIAEILQKKKGATRVMLYRAINALKELMEEKKKD
ncbi:MAG: RNA polymerase sigma factor [Candidatus Parcubacteria bacterium]|nr:RNA polymerase sigma factor [Candidatus Parcubacteria bacterium]